MFHNTTRRYLSSFLHTSQMLADVKHDMTNSCLTPFAPGGLTFSLNTPCTESVSTTQLQLQLHYHSNNQTWIKAFLLVRIFTHIAILTESIHFCFKSAVAAENVYMFFSPFSTNENALPYKVQTKAD